MHAAAHPGDRIVLPPLDPAWRAAMAPVLAGPDGKRIAARLEADATAGFEVYPPAAVRFAAFEHTPLERVRVVILGQDPYHGPGQAMGLSFSVPRGRPVPPSLRNVFAEQRRDLGIDPPDHGDLTAWADRGVLLLNSALSVRAGEAGSHASIGWQAVTDASIRAVSDHCEHVAFLLWGRHAQSKAALVDESRHLVLRAAHPSPLSAHRGFHGCGHFGEANAWLRDRGIAPVDWSLPA